MTDPIRTGRAPSSAALETIDRHADTITSAAYKVAVASRSVSGLKVMSEEWNDFIIPRIREVAVELADKGIDIEKLGPQELAEKAFPDIMSRHYAKARERKLDDKRTAAASKGAASKRKLDRVVKAEPRPPQAAAMRFADTTGKLQEIMGAAGRAGEKFLGALKAQGAGGPSLAGEPPETGQPAAVETARTDTAETATPAPEPVITQTPPVVAATAGATGDGDAEAVVIGNARFTEMSVMSFNHGWTNGDITYVAVRDPAQGVYLLFEGQCERDCRLFSLSEAQDGPQFATGPIASLAVDSWTAGKSDGVVFEEWHPIVGSEMEKPMREEAPKILKKVVEEIRVSGGLPRPEDEILEPE